MTVTQICLWIGKAHVWKCDSYSCTLCSFNEKCELQRDHQGQYLKKRKKIASQWKQSAFQPCVLSLLFYLCSHTLPWDDGRLKRKVLHPVFLLRSACTQVNTVNKIKYQMLLVSVKCEGASHWFIKIHSWYKFFDFNVIWYQTTKQFIPIHTRRFPKYSVKIITCLPQFLTDCWIGTVSTIAVLVWK